MARRRLEGLERDALQQGDITVDIASGRLACGPFNPATMRMELASFSDLIFNPVAGVIEDRSQGTVAVAVGRYVALLLQLRKTTLAHLVARELGSNFRSTSGPVIAATISSGIAWPTPRSCAK